MDVEWNRFDFSGHNRMIILTDENILQLYRENLRGFDVISIPPGEENKTQHSVDRIIKELLLLEADKDCLLVGLGGGVITDITGYVASVYKRGLPFALVPSTLMAMADAAIGGKNGINVSYFKNLVGTINQPGYILYDFSLLKTLPVEQWSNGLAEIIKFGCIQDYSLFQMMERYDLHQIQSDTSLAASLIEKSLEIKMEIVTRDELDAGNRRILNFGHTIGHAVERLHQLPHGHAVSIGMVAACALSERLSGLQFEEATRIVKVLSKYHLPVDLDTDYTRLLETMRTDKKRISSVINFILLENIGKATIRPVEIEYLQEHMKEIL